MYDGAINISSAKYKDLVGLCQKGLIPSEYHQFYKNLPHAGSVVDRLPEPDTNDLSNDEV